MATSPGVYKYPDANGNTVYSDQPPPADALSSSDTGKSKDDYKTVQKAIKTVQKEVPKAQEYLAALEYLRRHKPLAFNAYMENLKVTHRELWWELQSHQSFRPLKESAALEKNVAALLSIMKKPEDPLNYLQTAAERGIARAQAGAKQTGYMPEIKPGTPMGKVNVEGIRSVGRVMTRVMGPIVDTELAFLDPKVGTGGGYIALDYKLRELVKKGAIYDDGPEYEEILQLISSGQTAQANKMMNDLNEKHKRGGRP